MSANAIRDLHELERPASARKVGVDAPSGRHSRGDSRDLLETGGRACRGPVLLALACAWLFVLLAGRAWASGAQLSAREIAELLEGGVSSARVAMIVGERGISFEPTAAAMGALRDAGADRELVAAVEDAGKAGARQPEEGVASAAEVAFWNTIKDSAVPEDFGAYLARFPNGVFAELAEIRRRALGRSGVVVRSNVSGDEVLIDGKSVGRSGPAAHVVPPGKHAIEVRKSGFHAVKRDVTIAPGSTETVSVSLAPVHRPGARPATPAAGARAFSSLDETCRRQGYSRAEYGICVR